MARTITQQGPGAPGGGIVGAAAGAIAIAAAVLFGVAFAVTGARGEAASGAGVVLTPPPPLPAPFSRDCQFDGEPIAALSPLPNVTAALRQHRHIKILAIGASPAVGRRALRGGHTGEIRDILEQAVKNLHVTMINRGFGGELAAQAAHRIKNEVALNDPDLVLWQVGTNDALAYMPLDALEATIGDTVRWLKERKVDVVLVGLQYVDRMEQDDNYRKVRELIRRVAARENVMAVRRYEAQKLLSQIRISGGGLTPDEFESTEAGYVCLAQYLARAITLGVFGTNFKDRPLSRDPPAQN